MQNELRKSGKDKDPHEAAYPLDLCQRDEGGKWVRFCKIDGRTSISRERFRKNEETVKPVQERETGSRKIRKPKPVRTQ